MDKYQLLVKCDRVVSVIDDWMYNGECDLRLRMFKLNGCRVIETEDRDYAMRVMSVLDAAEELNLIKESKVSNYE